MNPLEAYFIARGEPATGARLVYSLEDATRRVHIHMRDRVMVVGFDCTTKTVKDWLRNFMFWLWTGPAGLRTPRGFWIEYDSFRDDLIRSVNHCDPLSIEIGAYSQGGPHAEYFLVDLIRKLDFRGWIDLDTNGAPGAWGRASAKAVRRMIREHGKVRIRRWVVAGDPVPDLPPPAWGYDHLAPATVLGEWDGPPWVGRHERYDELLPRV